MKKAWSNKYFVSAAILIALVVFFSWKKSSSNDVADLGGTAKVERGNLIQRVTISGTVQPARKSLITSSYIGYVRKIYVKLGDEVKAGNPIASVGTSLTADEQVFPLRAPISGKVVQLPKAEGEFIKASDPTDFIARIDDLSRLYVTANAPEVERVKIQVGQEAVVKASAILDRTYKATVREVTLAANETDKWQRSTVVEYPIRLELTDFDDRLKPGMSVLIDIVAQKKENVLILRHEFIGREKDQYFVTTLDNQVHNVHLGLQNEESSEILDGVSEGDVIRKVDFAKMVEAK